MNLFASASHWFHRRKRVCELRSFYQTDLRDSACSLDERVRFHLDRVGEYWQRCLGCLAQLPPEAIVAGDLFACVTIGTEAAGRDLRDYCSQHVAPSLLDAWQRYELHVAEIRPRSPNLRQSLESCAGGFSSVQELYAATTNVA